VDDIPLLTESKEELLNMDNLKMDIDNSQIYINDSYLLDTS
jgi:hypothetical protein